MTIIKSLKFDLPLMIASLNLWVLACKNDLQMVCFRLLFCILQDGVQVLSLPFNGKVIPPEITIVLSDVGNYTRSLV